MVGRSYQNERKVSNIPERLKQRHAGFYGREKKNFLHIGEVEIILESSARIDEPAISAKDVIRKRYLGNYPENLSKGTEIRKIPGGKNERNELNGENFSEKLAK